MRATVTNHVAEVAVPGQQQITVRLAHGELELGQEYDHEWHAIYVQPDNVLRLIRSLLVMVGLEDAHLYEQRPGGCCYDIDWPEGPFSPREVAMMASRPDIDWRAVLKDFAQVEADNTEHVPVKERRARVEAALRANPDRSNRAIAAECGVSDKTVGAVRAEIDAEIRDDAAEIRTEEPQLRLVAAE